MTFGGSPDACSKPLNAFGKAWTTEVADLIITALDETCVQRFSHNFPDILCIFRYVPFFKPS